MDSATLAPFAPLAPLARLACLACLACLASTAAAAVAYPTVTLTERNVLPIQGAIDEALADRFLRDSMQAPAPAPPRYVYIDSTGGSVDAGMRMLHEIRRANYTCIAERAYSMAFALLQACGARLVTPSALLMQHQISLGIEGDLHRVHSYLDGLRVREADLLELQARRLGLTVAALVARTTDEWWLMGANAIFRHGAADGGAHVACAPALLRRNRTIERVLLPARDPGRRAWPTPLEAYAEASVVVETFSRCPLLRTPLHTEVRAL